MPEAEEVKTETSAAPVENPETSAIEETKEAGDGGE